MCGSTSGCSPAITARSAAGRDSRGIWPSAGGWAPGPAGPAAILLDLLRPRDASAGPAAALAAAAGAPGAGATAGVSVVGCRRPWCCPAACPAAAAATAASAAAGLRSRRWPMACPPAAAAATSAAGPDAEVGRRRWWRRSAAVCPPGWTGGVGAAAAASASDMPLESGSQAGLLGSVGSGPAGRLRPGTSSVSSSSSAASILAWRAAARSFCACIGRKAEGHSRPCNLAAIPRHSSKLQEGSNPWTPAIKLQI